MDGFTLLLTLAVGLEPLVLNYHLTTTVLDFVERFCISINNRAQANGHNRKKWFQASFQKFVKDSDLDKKVSVINDPRLTEALQELDWKQIFNVFASKRKSILELLSREWFHGKPRDLLISWAVHPSANPGVNVALYLSSYSLPTPYALEKRIPPNLDLYRHEHWPGYYRNAPRFWPNGPCEPLSSALWSLLHHDEKYGFSYTPDNVSMLIFSMLISEYLRLAVDAVWVWKKYSFGENLETTQPCRRAAAEVLRTR
jgi:hypothetical protein